MAWQKVIPWTTDPTKMLADQVNFTVPIVITANELKLVANGGVVTNANGYDIVPMVDAGALTGLKFHRLVYDGVAGTWAGWVKLPTISATLALRVWLAVGNTSVTTDQQDKANAWDASTSAAYVAGDGTTIDLTDHSGNFALTNVGAVAAAGLFGGAFSTNGSTTYLERTASTPASAYPLTIEAMLKPAASVATTQTTVGLNATAGAPLGMTVQARATNTLRAQGGNSGSTPQAANGVLDTTNWHYYGAVYASDTSRSLVVDGAAEITSAVSAGTTATPDNISVGAITNNSTHSQFFNGLTNFVIISTVARSESWRRSRDAATRGYATFATVGAAQDVPSAASAANVALVAATGGDPVWAAIYDRRLNVQVVSSKVSAWDDAIGTYGGRTPGPQLTQATAGNRPAFSGTQGSGSELITLTAASSQYLTSAAAAAYALSPTTALYVVAIYEATGAGPICGIAKDETSSTTYPYAMLQGGGSNHKSDFAPEGVTTGRIQPDSGVAFADSVSRLAAIGHSIPVANNSASDVVWRYWFGGRQIRQHNGVTTATSGNNKIVVGRLGSVYGSGKLHWLGVTTQDLTKAQWQALIAFANAQFGAQAETSKRNTIVFAGDSLEYGSQSTDPMTAAIGTGTTSPSSVCVNTSSGSGTLIAQLLDVGDVHAYNRGVSGRTLQVILDEFAREYAPLIDGTRTGHQVLWLRGIGNFVQATNATIAQLRTVASAIYTAALAAGYTRVIWDTEGARGSGSNGTNGNNTGWWTANTWLTPSANGIVVATFNAELVATPTLYGTHTNDVEALSAFSIAGKAHLDTTYYNADKTHLTDTGYALLGTTRKTFLDATTTILGTASSPLRRRRR